MTDVEVLQFIALKMLYAVICGSVVGFERRINHAPAGFKTQILVCVGAMLFTCAPQIAGPLMAGETPRVIGQIVTGVGFLGAGSIIHNKSVGVSGLTTAAWIWFTASAGILIGLGHGLVSLTVTIACTAVICGFRKIEKKYFTHQRKIELDHDAENVSDIKKAG